MVPATQACACGGQRSGILIVPKSTTAEALEAQLFNSPSPAVLAKFRALNPGLNLVKAGQMIVLSDPENPDCSLEEAQLMTAAALVNEALVELSPEEADFLVRYREEIETMLTHGSTAMGMGAATFSKHLGNVKGLLKEIEALHTSTFARDGHLRSAEFFAERKRLFSQLNSHLDGLTKKGIGFPDRPKLKSALGISSRSLVHRWGKAGAPGMTPGYATHIGSVARVSKYVQYGGWVGTAVGGGASYLKVQDVCVAGNTKACEKVKYTEGGNFTGAVAGGLLAGGFFGVVGTGGICLAIGVPTAGVGTLLCGLVIVGGSSAVSGIALSKGGEKLGEIIYERTQ